MLQSDQIHGQSKVKMNQSARDSRAPRLEFQRDSIENRAGGYSTQSAECGWKEWTTEDRAPPILQSTESKKRRDNDVQAVG